MSFLDFILFFIFTFIYFYFYFYYLFIFSFVNAKFLVNLHVFVSSPSCVLFISAFQFCTRCCLPFPTLQSSHPLPSPPLPTPPLSQHTLPPHTTSSLTLLLLQCHVGSPGLSRDLIHIFQVKQQENEAALAQLPKRFKELDSMTWSQRQVALVEGILAGNVFDWGAKEVAGLVRCAERVRLNSSCCV